MQITHTHESISLFHLYNVNCSRRGENAARSIHWTHWPGGQKIARHDGWEEEGRRSWEGTICLHSTSLPLHWRTARSNQSLNYQNWSALPQPPLFTILICLALFLFASLVWNTYSSRRWQVPFSKRNIPATHQKIPHQNATTHKKLNSSLHICTVQTPQETWYSKLTVLYRPSSKHIRFTKRTNP